MTEFFGSLGADLPIAVAMALVGAAVFTLIGVVSGTDETATIAPLTLVVILLGVPPAGVFTFFLAGAISKHMTHAVPTMLLGIPGDTLAVPLMEEADRMRALGLQHLALRKAVAGGAIAAVISIPLAVLFAWILSPFGDFISSIAPWLFLLAAVAIAYSAPGRWRAVLALIPFVLLILGLQKFTSLFEVKLATSYFLGIAIGPMIFALASMLLPRMRRAARSSSPANVYLAPESNGTNAKSLIYPSPLRFLDATQLKAISLSSAVSSATFVFSPVAMTVLMGEVVSSRVKQGYQRLTTAVAAKNATTESTYMAESLIPLIAFGLPLSPVAAGPAAPLFNAPPVWETNGETGVIHNLSTELSTGEFLIFGLLAAFAAVAVAYPFVMRYAHSAAKFVVTRVSHEAIIAAFTGLVTVVSLWEGGIIGLVVTLIVGLAGGALIKLARLHAGVLFMGYYVAALSVPGILAML
ncbi:tripartite tricarboxylate transporter permease [Corynebacterium lactis]|uniref:Membrane protein n=1 Tax=Corynebacterium lactis RW2-5 TaxID=1408189 RepID=A0A0K2GZA0_9CORY|nr:tripartite tricarboxylate transporter permease [Corynebacterium lactis]ALA67013.1 membrane protein [Corynebacterium lactis RW2-5]